jgi:cytoskeletal protein CcmA (bactofilin family)
MKAGALYYSLFLCLLLLVIMGVVMLAEGYKRKLFANLETDRRLIHNVESGINYALSVAPNRWQNKHIALFQSEQDSVDIQKKRWGAFSLYRVSAFDNGMTRSKIFLVGTSFKKELNRVVIKNMPGMLNIGGEAQIKEALNVPESRLKIVNFEGRFPNANKQTYYLQADQDEFSLSNDFLKSCHIAFSQQTKEYQLAKHFNDFRNEKSIQRHFKDETLVMYAEDDIHINNQDLKGNIILVSDGSVFLGSHTKLKDVIIYAQSIETEEGFEGCCQLYAREKVYVGQRCRFNYPSVLAVFYNGTVNDPEITIENNAQVYGTLILHSINERQKTFNTPGNIKIEGSVSGVVLSDAYLENKGEINGTVVCAKFITKTNSGMYENYLVDGKVNIRNINLPFILPSIFAKQEKLNVIDWLY